MISSTLATCLICISFWAFVLRPCGAASGHDYETQISGYTKGPQSQASEIIEVQKILEIRQASSPSSSSTSDALSTFDPATTGGFEPSIGTGMSALGSVVTLASSPAYNILGWQAPDNTCGYVGGSLAKIKTCDINAACDVITTRDASAAGSRVIVGCCQPNNGCNFYGDCIESADYFSSQSTCSLTDDCPQDHRNTVLCTAATAPYCVPYSFSEWGASLYVCAATPVSSAELVRTTFAGQTDPRIWVPIFSDIGTSVPTGTSFLLSGPTAQPTEAAASSGRKVPHALSGILLFSALLFVL